MRKLNGIATKKICIQSTINAAKFDPLAKIVTTFEHNDFS